MFLSSKGIVINDGLGTADAVAIFSSLVLTLLSFGNFIGVTASALADPPDCYALFKMGHLFRIAIR